MEIITNDGQTFRSIREACDALGVSRSTVRKRVKAGVDIKDAIDPTFSRARLSPVTIAGKDFPRKVDAARFYGIPYDQFIERIELGWTLEEAAEIHQRKKTGTYKNYSAQIKAFSEAHGLTIRGAEKRLSMRRKRLRTWLGLKPKDNKAHINAVHVVDAENKWFYSISEAARYHKKRSTNILKLTKVVEEDKVYGAKMALDSEMSISFETLLALMTHQNVLTRETGDEAQNVLRLDNNVVIEILVNANNNQMTSTLMIEDDPIMEIKIVNNKPTILVIQESSVFQIDILKRFIKACSLNDNTNIDSFFKNGASAHSLKLIRSVIYI
jgi:hypothetical protein